MDLLNLLYSLWNFHIYNDGSLIFIHFSPMFHFYTPWKQVNITVDAYDIVLTILSQNIKIFQYGTFCLLWNGINIYQNIHYYTITLLCLTTHMWRGRKIQYINLLNHFPNLLSSAA